MSVRPRRPFLAAIGAMTLAIGVPLLMLATAQLWPRSAAPGESRLARVPRFHSRASILPTEPAAEPRESAGAIQLAERPETHLSGSVASTGEPLSAEAAAPASDGSRSTGIRLASRDPDAIDLSHAHGSSPAVPAPDWVAEVQPFQETTHAARGTTDPKPSVTLDVLPFDARTAAPQAPRDDAGWRERVKSLEDRLAAVFSDRLEQQARQFEAATRQLELLERDRRLQSLETSLQELKSSAGAEGQATSTAPPPIQLRKSAAEPPLFDLEARQAELGEVFQEIAKSAGIEVVVNPAVQGRISVLLKQKTLEDLLALLASSQSCVVEREGALWRVVSSAEVLARSSQRPEPESRTFAPRHVRARELAEFLRPLLTPEVGQMSAMDGGSAADEAAEPRGTLLVRDLPQVLTDIERMLRQFDVPLVEVELSAQVFSVDLTGSHARGVTLTGGQIVKQVPVPCPVCGGSHETVAAVMSVSSPAGEFLQAPGGLKYAFVKGDGRAVVSYLSQAGTTHPIGAPRVRVRNRQGVELVLSSLALPVSSGSDGAERRLRVRPAALSTGEFQLLIEEQHPHLSAGTAVLSADVKLREGTTVVIGGIVEQIGSANREILILLTPRIHGDWPAAEQP